MNVDFVEVNTSADSKTWLVCFGYLLSSTSVTFKAAFKDPALNFKKRWLKTNKVGWYNSHCAVFCKDLVFVLRKKKSVWIKIYEICHEKFHLILKIDSLQFLKLSLKYLVYFTISVYIKYTNF